MAPMLTPTPDDVLSYLKTLTKRQMIHLAVLLFLALVVIVSFFFIKSSFGTLKGQNQFLLDSLQHERLLLQSERAELHAQADTLGMLIRENSARDSAYVTQVKRQSDFLNSINGKLNNLDHAYQDILDVSRYNSDELRKFFADLK